MTMPDVPGTVAGTRGSPGAGLLSPRNPSTLSGINVGVACGFILVIHALSLASLVFTGPMEAHLLRGAALFLVSASVLIFVIGLLGSHSMSMGATQEPLIPPIAVMVAALTSGAAATAPSTAATAFAAMAAVTLCTGLFLVALGALRLGNLIRYVPFPVIGGVLAGVGLLVTLGGIELMATQVIGLRNLPTLFESATLLRWLPGLALGVGLLVISRRFTHHLTLPVLFVVTVLGFHAIALMLGVDREALWEGGWTLGPFDSGLEWKPLGLAELGSVQWMEVGRQAPTMVTVATLVAIGVLLHSSGLELMVRRDLGLNRELIACGTACTASAFVGALPGYQSVAFPQAALQMRANGRVVAMTAAAVPLAFVAFGSDLLTWIPRLSLGALLAYLGLGLLWDWVVESRRRMTRSEHAIIVLITLVTGIFGFMAGFLVGVLAGVCLFVFLYSRVDIIRYALTGAHLHSNVNRSESLRALLARKGDSILVLKLQGFLFFGTANRVLQRTLGRANDSERCPLQFVVLDFRHVSGTDSSALQSFVKLLHLAESKGFRVLFCGVAPDARVHMERTGIGVAGADLALIFPDTDHALEWCEERIISDAEAGDGAGSARDGDADNLIAAAIAGDGALGALHHYLIRRELNPGETLMRQGDQSDEVYFVESGRLSVRVAVEGGTPIRVRTLGPSTIVGEIAFYLRVARSASVVADTPSVVYSLSSTALEDMAREDPELLAQFHGAIARILASRVNDTTALLRNVMN